MGLKITASGEGRDSGDQSIIGERQSGVLGLLSKALQTQHCA